MVDAATEFFAQSNTFAQTMGQVVGGASVDLINADILGNQQRAAFYGNVLVDENGKARPPLPVSGDFSFVDKGKEDIDQEDKWSLSVPFFDLVDLSTFVLDTAEIEMRLNIKAHAADTSKYAATQKLVANQHLDWGVFGESSTLTCTAAESGSSTRSSDYRSKCLVKATMKRSGAPEGVSRVLDFMTEMGDIEKDLMRQKAQKAAQKSAQGDDLTDDSSDDTGTDDTDTGTDDTGTDDTGTDDGDDE